MADLVKLKGVRIILDDRAIRAVLADPGGPVARNMLVRGHRVLALAQRLVGVDSGRLRASLRVREMTVGGMPAVRIETNVHYARWHHDGTGLYGPHRQVIRPVRAKALKFTPKGASAPIFRKWVRGARGTFYLTRALEAAADPGEWTDSITGGAAARGPAWAGGMSGGASARPAWTGRVTAGPSARRRTTSSPTRRRRNPFRRRRT